MVAAALAWAWASTSSWMAAGETSGTSPERTTTGWPGVVSGSPARTAPPVPSGTGWVAVLVSEGRAAERSTPGDPTTTTALAPASWAAMTGHETIGLPQISCRTLGVADFIRVPCPAAITTALKEVTGRKARRSLRLRQNGRGQRLTGGWCSWITRWVLVPESGVQVLVPQPSIRTRTYVRIDAARTSLQPGGAARGRGPISVVLRGAASPGAATGGRQPRRDEEIRRVVGDLDRPLRSLCHTAIQR